MPRKTQWPPTILRHKSGWDRIRVRRDGRVKEYWLGPSGSDQARREYARLVAELAEFASEPPTLKKERPDFKSVSAVVAAWFDHARSRYGPDASEYRNHRHDLRLLLDLHGNTPADQFGPLALKAVQRMMAGRWCRRRVNRATVRIRTAWGWAESEEMVPAGSTAALRTVKGLRIGEHGVVESEPVLPVPRSDLRRARRHLPRQVRVLVDLLLLTGARVGELCSLRPCDLDRSGSVEVARGITFRLGAVWAYRPARHKTGHHGHARVILVGPRAQRLLAGLLDGLAGDSPVFATQRGNAFTRNDVQAYLARACRKAGVLPWSAGQLRHSAATSLARQFGLETARVLLGHTTARTTQIYALTNMQAAAEAVRRVG